MASLIALMSVLREYTKARVSRESLPTCTNKRPVSRSASASSEIT